MSNEAMAQELERQAAALRASAASGVQIPAFSQLTALPIKQPVQVPSQIGSLQTLIDERIDHKLATFQAHQPQSDKTERMLLLLLSQSITQPEMQWVEEHIKVGAPGFIQFLQSESVRAGVRMLFEDYKAFLAGKKQ